MKHTAKKISIEGTLLPSHQYTYVTTIGNSVLTRARTSDGAPVFTEHKYTPLHYLPTDVGGADSEGFDGTPLASHMSDSISDAKNFLEQHPEAFGDIQPEYMLLSDTYGTHDVPFDMDRLYIWNIDIEVAKDAERGHADVSDPFNPITAITVIWTHMGQRGEVCYGTKDYTPKGDELYIKCDDEADLLRRFLVDYRSGGDYPDIITGWFIQGFDIPYWVNRTKLVLGEKAAASISPYERLYEKTVMFYQQEHLNIEIKGVAILDYYELYRKFTYTQQESYKLDHIAHIELKTRKVSYAEHGTLDNLFRDDHQKFIEYNLQDVRIVDQLDGKVKLIELVCALAYAAKCNFADTFKQVRLWDIMIYHKLRSEGKQIPPRKQSRKGEQYEGAYVKEPQVGFHKWVVSFDVASMYPHIIRQWNLSPETLVDQIKIGTVDDLLARTVDMQQIQDQQGDVAIASNGVLTRKETEGFLPNMLKTLYDERVKFKKIARKAESDLQTSTDPEEKKRLVKLISASNNQQQVRKVNLNSAYGALGSNYFRFYDVRLAEAVTISGQMVIRWVANDLNAYLNRALHTSNEDYIIASDTDSVYVRLEKVVDAFGKTRSLSDVQATVNMVDQFCKAKLLPIIDKTLADVAAYMNVYIPCMSMARECIADKGIWTAKKRYILNVYNKEGVAYDKPKLKIMGIEAIKSSTPAIVRDMIKKALDLLMNGNQQDVWAHIQACEHQFYAAPFEDIAFPRGVNELTKYAGETKSIPIAVRGALAFNDMLKRTKLDKQYELIRDGEKIKFCHLREPNPLFSHVISAPGGCPPEWKIESWIDYDEQFDKSFLEPMQTILGCAGWSTKRQAALDLF